jgi:hypothetical protein
LNQPVYELLKGLILNLIKETYFLVGKKQYYIVVYCILETPGSIVQRADHLDGTYPYERPCVKLELHTTRE